MGVGVELQDCSCCGDLAPVLDAALTVCGACQVYVALQVDGYFSETEESAG